MSTKTSASACGWTLIKHAKNTTAVFARFKTIRWIISTIGWWKFLADGDAQALGEYPYPSPVLRH